MLVITPVRVCVPERDVPDLSAYADSKTARLGSSSGNSLPPWLLPPVLSPTPVLSPAPVLLPVEGEMGGVEPSVVDSHAAIVQAAIQTANNETIIFFIDKPLLWFVPLL